MAKFIFRAEPALTMRRKLEDEARLRLADAQRRAYLAEDELRKARESLSDATRRACENEAQATDPTLAIWYRNWIKRQQREVARSAQVLDGRRAEVGQAEQRVMEAHRAVRALEKLRQKALDEFTDHERRTEQKEIDLLGVMQYAMRSRDQGRHQ
jgi:flagellar protein FliJ